MTGSNTLTFTSESWESEVLRSETPVLVDFWADGCGPCRMMSPAVDGVADQYAGRVKVGKLKVEANAAVAERYGIRGVPTLLAVKGGRVAAQKVGAMSQRDLAALVEAHL